MHGRVARTRMIARSRRPETDLHAAVAALEGADGGDARSLSEALRGPGVPVDLAAPDGRSAAIEQLARWSLIEFAGESEDLVLTPVRADFSLGPVPAVAAGTWKLSRFTWLTFEDGRLVARNPLADCVLAIGDPAAQALLLDFAKPAAAPVDAADGLSRDSADVLCALFARARLILPCDDTGRTADEVDDAARQWDVHELLFHSRSRLGRMEGPIGATYAFRGEIPPQAALKEIPEAWLATIVELPRPDLAALAAVDLPLTVAIEQRRSIRQHSIVPPSKVQLGEFLFRTARVRDRRADPAHGDFAFRPYPGGGACYEMEVYAAVDACIGVPRGFYYYDPLSHRLCRVSPPDARMEAMLQDAFAATAGQGRPQILLTLASRFNRFNWKYRGMAYAAELKNVGVIYQTWYLVATAMNLAGCALGIGNTDRFGEMTGLDYLEEGSIGEFMLGRPL